MVGVFEILPINCILVGVQTEIVEASTVRVITDVSCVQVLLGTMYTLMASQSCL